LILDAFNPIIVLYKDFEKMVNCGFEKRNNFDVDWILKVKKQQFSTI